MEPEIIIKEYTTTGRVYNEKDNSSLEGVKVYMSPLVGDKRNTYKTKTDKLGNFELTFSINTTESYQHYLVTEKTHMFFTKPGYTKSYKLPYVGAGIVRLDVGLIGMSSFKSDLKKEITKVKNIDNNAVTSAINSIPNDPEAFLNKNISNYCNQLRNKIIPIAIALIAEFGINKIQEALTGNYEGECPDPKNLPNIINKRNKIVKNLNNTYKIINSVIKAIGITNGLIEILKIASVLMLKLPIPVVIGTPPGPQGGVIYSWTIGQILSSEDKAKKIDELIAKYQHISLSVLISLIILRSVLDTILNLLDIVDKNIGACVENFLKEEIDPELLAYIEEARKIPSPTTRIVNGFILGIEKENKQIGILTRKYAVAKNKQGVVLLKGEPSFSSNEQVLMDGLEFYIETNELKAY